MEENTVNISLRRYNELRDLETAINENKTTYIIEFNKNKTWFDSIPSTYNETLKVMSTDEAVKEIAKKSEKCNQKLKKEIEDLKKQLSSKEEQLRNLIVDHRWDIINIKGMSIFQFLRYRNR